MSNFFERLREERERLGYSQSKFAYLGGVTQTSQSSYERGARTPDVNYLIALSQHSVDIGYLITGNRAGEELDNTNKSPRMAEAEIALLEQFRDAPQSIRRFVLAGLAGLKG